jgi:hypothetical protein
MDRHARILASAETPILEARIEAPHPRSFLMASSPIADATHPSMMTRIWGSTAQGSAWLPWSWMLPSCWQARTTPFLFFVCIVLFAADAAAAVIVIDVVAASAAVLVVVVAAAALVVVVVVVAVAHLVLRHAKVAADVGDE